MRATEISRLTAQIRDLQSELANTRDAAARNVEEVTVKVRRHSLPSSVCGRNDGRVHPRLICKRFLPVSCALVVADHVFCSCFIVFFVLLFW